MKDDAISHSQQHGYNHYRSLDSLALSLFCVSGLGKLEGVTGWLILTTGLLEALPMSCSIQELGKCDSAFSHKGKNL